MDRVDATFTPSTPHPAPHRRYRSLIGTSADQRLALSRFTDKGACSGVGQDYFYPQDNGEAGRPTAESVALRIETVASAEQFCRRQCDIEVRISCLSYAIEYREGFGVWGGYSTKSRRKIARAIAAGNATVRQLVEDTHHHDPDD